LRQVDIFRITRKDLFLLLHELLDEVLVVDLTVGVFSTLEDDLDFIDSELLAESGKNMSDLSAHNSAVAFLVENSKTLDEVLESTVLLLLGAEFDVVDELVEVAGLGVHFLLLWAAESFHDIGVGGLEAEASDEIADLVVVELALAGSIVELETVLDIFNLILGEFNLKYD